MHRSFAIATFSLFNLPLADIADHDKEKYNRRWASYICWKLILVYDWLSVFVGWSSDVTISACNQYSKGWLS